DSLLSTFENGVGGWLSEFAADEASFAWFEVGPGLGFTDGTGIVQIINLVGSNGSGNYQDQLVLIPGDVPPPPGAGVPEAGSLAIWGLLGMATAVGCRWRRKKVAA